MSALHVHSLKFDEFPFSSNDTLSAKMRFEKIYVEEKFPE